MKMTREKMFEMEYPQNLIRSIFLLHNDDDMEGIEGMEPGMVPKDQAGTLEYIMLTTLSEREHQILHARYMMKMTLEETGELFSVGRERIRQIEAKAIRKLRHPSRSRLIMKGLAYWKKQEIEGTKQSDLEKARYEGYAQAQKDCEMIVDYKLLKEARAQEAIKRAKEEEKRNDPKETPIDIINLSVRSFNCLKRAGIEKIGDIVMRWHEISNCRIRNMGYKSVEEIREKLKEYGVNV